jgi:hypothetical protein
MTDAEIRAFGWQALVDKLGPSGAVRFVVQTEHGYGDYSDLRHKMLGELSVDELLDRMRKGKRERSQARVPHEKPRSRAGRARAPRGT